MPRKEDDVSDLAARDDLAGELHHGVLEIGEPHQRACPGRGRRVAHRARRGGIDRKGFLAVHGLARLEGREGHLGMERIRRGDRDDVDLRVAGELPPVSGRSREPERVGGAPRRRFVDVREEMELGLDGQVEQPGHGAERVRVALPHEPGADESDACHRLRPCLGHRVVPLRGVAPRRAAPRRRGSALGVRRPAIGSAVRDVATFPAAAGRRPEYRAAASARYGAV